VFDGGLQHERTSLAWERTAISMMVAGIVLSRFAATEAFWLLAGAGMVQVVFAAALLVWSGTHYEELHGTLRDEGDILFPNGVRLVGMVTIAGSAAALIAASLVVART